MNDLMSIITGRRSIRAFQDREIPEKALNQVLESVKWCPSWANSQCWEIILIRDQAGKERLQELLHHKNPAEKAVVQAPVVIALCGKTGTAGYYKGKADTSLGDWFMFDLGIAAQTLCLTAHSLGLGTVIIGALDHIRANEVLGVGDGYKMVAFIPIGYPAKTPSPPRRREAKDFTHYEVF